MFTRKTGCSKNGGVIINKKPDLALTYGDIDSTFSEILSVSKLWIISKHIDSGLRSSDRSMPEEIKVSKDYGYQLNPQIAEI